MLTHFALTYKFSDAETRFTILNLLGAPLSEKDQHDYNFLQSFNAKLKEKIISLTSTKELAELTNNTILKIAVNSLKSNKAVKKIHLEQLDPEMVLKILINLEHNRSVSEISLTDIDFSLEQFNQLIQYIRACRSLESLSFGRLKVNNIYMTSEPLYLKNLFTKSFSIWSRLARIELIGMELNDKSGPVFFEYISRLPISELKIASMCLSIHSIGALATYLGSASDLKQLSLQKSSIKYFSNGGHTLSNIVPSPAHDTNSNIFRRVGGDFLLRTLIKTLKHETKLTKIDLSDCAISSRHINEFVSKCSEFSLEFNLSNNEIGPNAQALLTKQIKNICLDAQKSPPEGDQSEWDSLIEETISFPITIISHQYQQPFELVNMLQCSELRNTPQRGSQSLHYVTEYEYIMHTIKKNSKLYAFYLGLSQQLSYFLAGAQNIASGLIEPSIDNVKVLGVEHGLELGTIFSGPIIPLSIGLYILRKTLVGAARNQIINQCNRLLSLLDPSHYDYFRIRLPALITILCADEIRQVPSQPTTEVSSVWVEQFLPRGFLSKVKPADPFQTLLAKVLDLTFHAWSETATQNRAKESYMTAEPETWMMHMMQQIAGVEGPAQINYHLNKSWDQLEKNPIERIIFTNHLIEDRREIIIYNQPKRVETTKAIGHRYHFWPTPSSSNSETQAENALELQEINNDIMPAKIAC